MRFLISLGSQKNNNMKDLVETLLDEHVPEFAEQVELKLPVIPDIELTATKTAEVISKHMSLSEEKTGEISMAIIESCINAFEHSKTKETPYLMRSVLSKLKH